MVGPRTVDLVSYIQQTLPCNLIEQDRKNRSKMLVSLISAKTSGLCKWEHTKGKFAKNVSVDLVLLNTTLLVFFFFYHRLISSAVFLCVHAFRATLKEIRTVLDLFQVVPVIFDLEEFFLIASYMAWYFDIQSLRLLFFLFVFCLCFLKCS